MLRRQTRRQKPGDAVLAIYLAGLCDYKDKLAAGEVGTVLLIAPDKKQAKVLLDYAEGTPKLLLVCGVTNPTSKIREAP